MHILKLISYQQTWYFFLVFWLNWIYLQKKIEETKSILTRKSFFPFCNWFKSIFSIRKTSFACLKYFVQISFVRSQTLKTIAAVKWPLLNVIVQYFFILCNTSFNMFYKKLEIAQYYSHTNQYFKILLLNYLHF